MNQETGNPGNLIKSDKRRTSVKTTIDNQKIIKNQIISARAEAARIVAGACRYRGRDSHRRRVVADAICGIGWLGRFFNQPHIYLERNAEYYCE